MDMGGTGEGAASEILLALRAGELKARGRTLQQRQAPPHAVEEDDGLLAGGPGLSFEYSPLADIPASFWDDFIWHGGEAAWPEGDFSFRSRFETTPVQWCEVEILHIWSPRGGRPAGYDWPAFEAEALSRLEDEGGYHPDFRQADLERHMAQWAQAEWGREPGEASIRRHVRKAHMIYLGRSVK
jgi:hypothetical protein